MTQQPERMTDKARLDFFEQNPNCELSHDIWDEEASWFVHRVTGGRNDREWTCIGTGETPREAIDAALNSSRDRSDTEAAKP